MQRQIQLTADGSHTVSIPELNISYHSKHGAVQESMHVFIEAGLLPLFDMPQCKEIHILEIGFGTGLNALLTWRAAKEKQKHIFFTSIEAYPLSAEEWQLVNHGDLLLMKEEWLAVQFAEWGKPVSLDASFTLEKKKIALTDFTATQKFHCIYFDAFDPLTQPELWTQASFEKLRPMLYPGGSLVTYCSKSVIRHAMTAAGFEVKKIPGPYGKREMVIAHNP